MEGKKNIRRRNGFTLVETLVGVFLLAILATGIYGSFAFGMKISTQNRLRIQATAVAERRIEAIKAMNYEDIGTAGSVPNGYVPKTETETIDTNTFTTAVKISYVDDPYDDTFPTDIAPYDYKKVEVRVSWPSNMESKDIVMTTIISPPKIETNLGTGVLVINSVDGNGLPVPNCALNIKNSGTNPPIDFSTETDGDGTFVLIGAPSETGSFEISLSKAGYESVKTYPPYPTSSFNPIDPHVTVTEGKITSKTFVMDKTSTLVLNFKDTLDAVVPDVAFSLKGGRIIGTTVAAAPQNVYFYDQSSLTADANGIWQASELGKGPYYFTFASNPNYEEIYSGSLSPWSLASDTTLTVNPLLGAKTQNILVIQVKNRTGGAPIVGALVNIKDTAGVLFQEALTDVNGFVYFPQIADPAKVFLNARYNITVTKSGFRNLTDSATFAGGIIRKTELIRR